MKALKVYICIFPIWESRSSLSRGNTLFSSKVVRNWLKDHGKSVTIETKPGMMIDNLVCSFLWGPFFLCMPLVLENITWSLSAMLTDQGGSFREY